MRYHFVEEKGRNKLGFAVNQVFTVPVKCMVRSDLVAQKRKKINYPMLQCFNSLRGSPGSEISES